MSLSLERHSRSMNRESLSSMPDDALAQRHTSKSRSFLGSVASRVHSLWHRKPKSISAASSIKSSRLPKSTSLTEVNHSRSRRSTISSTMRRASLFLERLSLSSIFDTSTSSYCKEDQVYTPEVLTISPDLLKGRHKKASSLDISLSASSSSRHHLLTSDIINNSTPAPPICSKTCATGMHLPLDLAPMHVTSIANNHSTENQSFSRFDSGLPAIPDPSPILEEMTEDEDTNDVSWSTFYKDVEHLYTLTEADQETSPFYRFNDVQEPDSYFSRTTSSSSWLASVQAELAASAGKL
jgi:hypothetical protein